MTKSFTAGPRTTKPRSDLRVTYIPGNRPLVVEVRSKVQVLFGADIKARVRAVCDDLQVDTGKLEIEDFGALPFVIAARVETVLKQAFPENRRESLPPLKEHCMYSSRPDRFRRSRLYIPGNQPKLMVNAGIHKPDGVILDLEDSVAPGEKESARNIVRNALRTVNFFGAERMVRINQGESGLADLEFVVPHNVHVILIPKVESGDRVRMIDERIDRICRQCGRGEPVYLMPIIESARGVMSALEIAEASKNNVALAIGLEDYTADLGVQRSDDGRESFFARSMVVNAARAAGLQATDSVFSDVTDMDRLRAAARESRALGFDGMGCIHPRQIAPVHEVFAPSAGEIKKAKDIVLAFEEATAKGLGVVSLGSKMIDPPVVKRAQRTINLAVETGVLPKNWKESGNG